MKKIFLGLALIVTIAVIAQKTGGAPDAAKAAFAKAYPNATKVKWEKEDGNYEVSFVQGGNELSAIYNPKGVLQESEQEMKVNELPAAIMTYMKEHYKGITVKGAAKITKADGSVNYEAAVKGKDVLFDANGKFLKEAKD
ncbi:hypothetical protein GWC95_18910 [Sediminibacterium roseum]|uniref:Putative beta-lactamase-inhibitor-like PepSY-like domain-containing protein n=1 Tax=Sediminibacterium roseum TaxID=1978412 RepID=A0ABX0A221_9BACT|nr:PepSY-like domain-containing protein [Sediminibacterium roseum]NCI52002.1 hypothetical protein [Sediminibacterium roseum]